MKEKTYCKYIFFNTKEEAERFISLYGGHLSNVLGFEKEWNCKYYGNQIKDMTEVMFRSTTKEFNKIKEAILLKEKKGFNSRRYYVME